MTLPFVTTLLLLESKAQHFGHVVRDRQTGANEGEDGTSERPFP